MQEHTYGGKMTAQSNSTDNNHIHGAKTVGNREKEIKKILLLILIANWTVAGLKIMLGTLINSGSMTADGFHSLSDGASNIVGLVGMKMASKPVDEDHPYGHRKFETLASLAIAGMLFVLGGKVILDAIPRFSNPVMPEVGFASLAVLVVTLGVNIFVAVWEHRKGRSLGSQILTSDSMHTRSDIFVTIGVLITLIGLSLGLPAIVDPIASLIVAGFILKAAYDVFCGTSSVLVDQAVMDVNVLKAIAMEFQQVRDVHKIRSRGSEMDLFLDMHVMVDPSTSVEESHRLMHELEARYRQRLEGRVKEAIVHIEPWHPERQGISHD